MELERKRPLRRNEVAHEGISHVVRFRGCTLGSSAKFTHWLLMTAVHDAPCAFDQALFGRFEIGEVLRTHQASFASPFWLTSPVPFDQRIRRSLTSGISFIENSRSCLGRASSSAVAVVPRPRFFTAFGVLPKVAPSSTTEP